METLEMPSSTVTGSILPEILALDFERIKYKLRVKEEGERWTMEQTALGELEYKRYLTLIKIYRNRSIVPSQLMDDFWHQHILDTKAYREDCDKIFGYFIDHFPYFGIYGNEDKQNLLDAFEETKRIYREQFGCEIDRFEASRCEGHACHVESECACRVEGACKNV